MDLSIQYHKESGSFVSKIAGSASPPRSRVLVGQALRYCRSTVTLDCRQNDTRRTRYYVLSRPHGSRSCRSRRVSDLAALATSRRARRGLPLLRISADDLCGHAIPCVDRHLYAPRETHYFRQMSMPKRVRARTWRPPLPRTAGDPDAAKAARRVARAGRAAIRRQHPSSPRARRGRSLPCCGELTFRVPTRHRTPDQQPGRILIPGDGAAGDQKAQNSLPARRCVRGHEKVSAGGQVEVPGCGQLEVPVPRSSCCRRTGPLTLPGTSKHTEMAVRIP